MRTPRWPVRLTAALALSLAALAVRGDEPASPAARSAPTPRCSIPSAESWREYRSAHFVLSTDVSARRAAELVGELERTHALVVAALFGPDVEVPGTLHVVAFASPGQFEELAPEHVAGYMKLGWWQSFIVFPFEGRDPIPEVVAHEIAHEVSWHHFTRQPPWFREGLAMFVQSVGVERSDAAAPPTGSHLVRGGREHGGRWAGFPSPNTVNLVSTSLAVGAKELLEWRGKIDDADPGRFHAGSWLLYHYLWNKRSKAFSDYQERLSNGDDPAAAWRAAFPDLDPASSEAMARLDDGLAEYRRFGRYASYRVEVGAVDASFQARAISSADLHLLLLDVRAESRKLEDPAKRIAAARAIFDEALREDPTQPEALAFRALQDKASVAAAVRPATVARPGDFRAWLLLAGALDSGTDAQEKEAALRKAVALPPPSADANNSLAWLLLRSGRAREARPFAERALDLAPWDPAIVDTLAAVAFGIGQCKPALALQRRAADLHAPGDRTGDGVRKRLAEYEARCGGAGTAPAPAAAAPR